MALVCEVQLGRRSYPVWIGEDAVSLLATFLQGHRGGVVTDENVERAQGHRMSEWMDSNWRKWVLPAGEATKTPRQVAELLEKMAAAGLGRDSWLVAFGGGVVGDVTGFAAAVYMRGIRFVQVPTTLLAMVDSSVGGKTGVNLRTGKNLMGAFWQPSAVAADPRMLATLPEREYRSGLAEVVKMALGLDAGFFTWLEGHAAEVAGRDVAAVEHVVAECVRLKASVVAADERETTGRRALLNLGHTFGHALEVASGYQLTHGEAVARGLLPMLSLSMEQTGFLDVESQRVRKVLDALHLLDTPIPSELDGAAAWQAMQRDKKGADGTVRMVLCRHIGEALPPTEVEGLTESFVVHAVRDMAAGK